MIRFKKNRVLPILIATIMILLLSLFACAKDTICGGTIYRKTPFARKKIKSDKLVSFTAKFYRDGTYEKKYGYIQDGSYLFEVKPHKTGKLIVSENCYYKTSAETDETILSELQKIIVKYNLVNLNGLAHYTQGLPPEFQPAYIEAKYDSGERLSFCITNDPHADWSKDIVHILRDELARRGKIPYIEFVFKAQPDKKDIIRGKTFYAQRFYTADSEDPPFTVWLNEVFYTELEPPSAKNNIVIPYSIKDDRNRESTMRYFDKIPFEHPDTEIIWKITTDKAGDIIDVSARY